MPAKGYQPPQRLFVDDSACTVRFIAEPDGDTKDFDFTALPVSRDLQVSFAQAFHDHTGPAGKLKAVNSVKALFRFLRIFCEEVLAVERVPPVSAGQLTPAHLDQFRLHQADLASREMNLGVLRALLAHVDGLTPAFLAKCAEWLPQRRGRLKSHDSYTAGEEKRILDAARQTIKAAAQRIREHQTLLQRWRDGDTELTGYRERYFELLDFVERTGDVPRYVGGTMQSWINKDGYGTVPELMTTVNLTHDEAAAFAVLLVRLTGENGDTILKAPAAHHRPDGGAGPIATAQIDVKKPRRGRRSYMTAALSDLPTWASAPRDQAELSGHDELHTPFGVYMLLLELTSSARRITGSPNLFVYWIPHGRGFVASAKTGIVGAWGRNLQLIAEPSGPGPCRRLIVSAARMRLTHVAREQRPVAHTTQTLADTYLRRDRSTLDEYQGLVADVLTEETDKARAVGAIAQLTAADVAESVHDPSAVARRFGVDEATLRLLVARDADTVLAGCTDNLNGPFGPPGQPCRASFLKCLDCPCARALPHHLPVQIAARDLLNARRAEMTALRWAQRFAYPFTQLEDLLRQVGDDAVRRAAQQVGDTERDLVNRLLNRELDQT